LNHLSNPVRGKDTEGGFMGLDCGIRDRILGFGIVTRDSGSGFGFRDRFRDSGFGNRDPGFGIRD
jgi:hypothetical protein